MIESFDAEGKAHGIIDLDSDTPVKFWKASAEWRTNPTRQILWIPGKFHPHIPGLFELDPTEAIAILPELTGESQPVELGGERCAQELAASSVSTGPSGSGSITHPQSSYSSYYPSQ